METPLITEHREAAARLGEFSGCVLPEGFSDFNTEYRAMRHSVALLDTSWHAVIALAGRDRVRYLHAISSNHIAGLQEGRGAFALLLNPQGRILSELEVYAQSDKLLTLSHASARERTAATLKKYIIMDDVKLDDLTDQVGSVAVEGPRATAIVQQACGLLLNEIPEMSIRDVHVEKIACQMLRRSHFGEPGAEFIARREWLPSLWRKLLTGVRAHGGEPVGMVALNSARLEAGIPWFPQDFNDSVIPHEASLIETHISFTKGCYTGQEIVERVRSRGHVNRKRMRLKFSTAAPPLPGTLLLSTGIEVGQVTSAAYSPEAGSAIGMGYVRRDQHAPGSTMEFEGGTATVMG
ncbi:MAG TPA: glycine cleavage T C-terminal barrel domain-containing protein [Candidatus Acidoferrales bacterium]|nr:glycine cleavage T C-terminal barrel domain-containing protein [Candidatus Acidoferrales bacterium]